MINWYNYIYDPTNLEDVLDIIDIFENYLQHTEKFSITDRNNMRQELKIVYKLRRELKINKILK